MGKNRILKYALALLFFLSVSDLAMAQSEALVKQVDGAGFDKAYIGILVTQVGAENYITGLANAAPQSAGGYNLLDLFQTAGGNNYASFTQAGCYANSAEVSQFAGVDNYVLITQSNSTGPANRIRRAMLTIPDPGIPVPPAEFTGSDVTIVDGSCYQNSNSGSNHLEVEQNGDNNDLGLYQGAYVSGNNYAKITQNGNNYCAIYMIDYNGLGGNKIDISQDPGGPTVLIYQIK